MLYYLYRDRMLEYDGPWAVQRRVSINGLALACRVGNDHGYDEGEEGDR
jgi:hypothetical protein